MSDLTHWKKLQNPDHLGAYALQPGQEPVITIQSVRLEMVKGPDGKEERRPVLYFAEPGIKPMVLNVTNSKTIAKLYGTPYIEEWSGKRIQIYAAKVKAFGEEVEALRIRPKVPAVKLPELTPQHEKWTGAVNSLANKTTDLDGVKKHFILSAENEARLLKEVEQCRAQDS